MLQDVSKMTRSEIEAREESQAPVVNDKRRSYDETAESNGTEEVITPAAEPEIIGVDPAEPAKKVDPKDYPTLHVPSLMGGTIPFRVGELFPWRGVFFVVADVKNVPAPHMIVVPVDHTGAHKKLAKKFNPSIKPS